MLRCFSPTSTLACCCVSGYAEIVDEKSKQKLTVADVEKVARLSRLALSQDAIREQQTRLVAVLDYVDRLQSLDLSGVEPLTNPADEINAVRTDDATTGLPTDTLSSMSPEMLGPFVRVPKVLGDGGGA